MSLQEIAQSDFDHDEYYSRTERRFDTWFRENIPHLYTGELAGETVRRLDFRTKDSVIHRVVFDLRDGRLVVDGDLRSAVYQFGHTSFAEIADYGRTYFASKLQSSHIGSRGKSWDEGAARLWLVAHARMYAQTASGEEDASDHLFSFLGDVESKGGDSYLHSKPAWQEWFPSLKRLLRDHFGDYAAQDAWDWAPAIGQVTDQSILAHRYALRKSVAMIHRGTFSVPEGELRTGDTRLPPSYF
jgi:hypothetical protein